MIWLLTQCFKLISFFYIYPVDSDDAGAVGRKQQLLTVCVLQEAERVLDRIDQLHLEFAKKAAVRTSCTVTD